jgi:inosine-uridine nucleoside N-ribohydrolase
MLLGWPGVEVVGITTSTDGGGRRAGYVHRLLSLAGRADGAVPVAAGAEVCLTTGRPAGEIPDVRRYWGVDDVAAVPSSPGAALELLDASIEGGATVVCIGPFTNLGLLETLRPGRLAEVPVVVMGGWTRQPPPGFPPWGPETDFNVQSDTRAAELVLLGAGAPLTIVGIDVTMQVHLRAAHLDRLRAAGAVGEVLARSSAAYGDDAGYIGLGRALDGVPDDLVNFHHDPLACAVALGWDGVDIVDQRLAPVVDDAGVLRLVPSPDGRDVRTVTAVDGPAFAERWLEAVEAITPPR